MHDVMLVSLLLETRLIMLLLQMQTAMPHGLAQHSVVLFKLLHPSLTNLGSLTTFAHDSNLVVCVCDWGTFSGKLRVGGRQFLTETSDTFIGDG